MATAIVSLLISPLTVNSPDARLLGGKSCPSGYKEIGSNNEYCHSQGGGFSPIRSYQAACCSVETDNMKLYSQCDWSAKVASSTWPSCEKATCGSDVIAFSGDGSGDAMCWGAWYKGGMEDSKKNKYCCDQPEEDKKWKDCEWQGMTDVSHPVRLWRPSIGR